VIVVLGPDQPIPPLPAGVRIVRDAEALGGPLVALAAGLEATRTELAIVVGGDMPRLRPDVLGSMLGALDAADVPQVAVVLDDGEGPRPLPLATRVRPARIAAAATLASSQRSLRAFLDQLDVRAISVDEWHRLDPRGETLVDIDRPEDLERVRASGPGERGLP
jgi:molybdopterin-guanine dinucleotide biosynthesis protein A